MVIKLSARLDQPSSLEEFAVARRNDKQITKKITEALYTTFVTALEREDIEALGHHFSLGADRRRGRLQCALP